MIINTKIIAISTLILVFTQGGLSLKALAVTLNKDSPVYYYVNHESQLYQIREHLNSSGTVSITGTTAMGKSEMAKKYAEQYEDEYDIIAIFDTGSNLTAQFIDLIRKINHNICVKEGCSISDNPKVAKENLLSYLKDKKHWLLIFDNLHISENQKIKDIIELKHSGHVIICSQEEKYLDRKVKAPYLKPDESYLIIKKIMQNPSREYLNELTNLFQGQPYMVANSAIYLQNNPHMTIEDYVKYMKGNDNKIMKHLELCLSNMRPDSKNILYIISLINNQNVSRQLLSQIVDNKDKLSTYIDELIGYGLIEQVDNEINSHTFRMHDVIQSELANSIDDKVKIINFILDKMDKLMPLNQTVPERIALISAPSVQSNLEKLVQNAEVYGADVYKTMRGNDILLDHYLKIRDWENCKLKAEWLTNKKKIKSIELDNMSNEEMVTYGHYLTNIGVYKDFAEADFLNSIKYYEEAKEILNRTKGYYLVYNTVYFQLALTQTSIGDISNAKKNIANIEKVLKENNVPIEKDRVLYGISKIYLAQGNYEKALEEINKLEKAESHLYKQTVATPIYLLKAEILNYMHNFQEAYNICNSLYLKEYENFKTPHEILARILTQLSRAELGLNMKADALKHSLEASQFFKKEYENSGHKHPVSDKFAAALTAHADSLAEVGELQEAIKNYSFARNIYFNRYRDNFKNMDDVSYNLAQAARAAYQLKDNKSYKIFRDNLLQKFGTDHFRSREIISSYEMKPKL